MKVPIIIIGLIAGLLAGYIYGFAPLTGLTVAIFSFCSALAPALIILSFCRDEVLRSWGKFFIGWFIVSILIIFGTPEHGDPFSGGFSVYPVLDRKMIAMFMGGLFFVISLILIAWKSWRLRGK